jgi:microcystin-dependent protein
MSTPFLGEIRLFSFNYAPKGWALCNGQLLSIAQNSALYNLVGTTYGGDGVSTFALPNLQGRVPVHEGTGGSVYDIGQAGGSESEVLSVEQLPAHTHAVAAHKGPGASTIPTGRLPAATSGDSYGGPANVSMEAGMIGETGGGAAVSVVQPYLTVSFCIALTGVYPSQS